MIQPNTPHSLIIDPVTLPAGISIYDVFSRIEQAAWSMLFDSASAQDGRYHIMLWQPAWMVTAKQNTVYVTDNRPGAASQSAVKHAGAPLACVKTLMDSHFGHQPLRCNNPALYHQLPFLVGAAGLCGYDLGRYYETLPEHNPSPYLCPDMAIGLFEQSVIADTHTGKLYHCRLAHIAPLHEQAWYQHNPAAAPSFGLTGPWQSNLSQQTYTQALRRIHQYIVAGDCYQINMAQRFSAPYRGSEWQAYQRLRDTNNTPFSAFIRLEQSCILSISPERFIAVNEGKVQSKPIKGTRPRYSCVEQDNQSAQALLCANKDRAENLMIVDLLRNDLSKHCQPHSVHVPHLFALKSYAAVHHMVSTVEGQLCPDACALDLLAGAFPGGSITGAPKIRAMEIIEELEPDRRNIYCGSIMYYGIKQDMDSSITIRTLLAENQQLYCWAGGGIVLDSDESQEYQETLDKVSRILPALEDML